MKTLSLISIFIITIAAVMVSGCASTIARLKGPDVDMKYADYAGEPVKSFWLSSFDGWTVVSDNQVVIRAGFDKAYLVKVTGYCPDLKFTNTLGVTSFAGQVDKFEKIVVGHDRCMINEIRPVDVARMRADSKALKKQAAATS